MMKLANMYRGRGAEKVSRTQPTPEDIRTLAYKIRDKKERDALRVKLLSPKGRLPTKGTDFSAGYNLTSTQQLLIPKGG